MSSIESPCIKVCRTDINGLCIGCKRTRDEIGDWSRYTEKEKSKILDKASSRIVEEHNTGGFSF